MQSKGRRRTTPADREPMGTEEKRGGGERFFWAFVCGIVLVLALTRVFDYSLMPPSYQGLFIARPCTGLYSDSATRAAWAARSHVRYGFGYTKGFRTLVVGDPPPERPVYQVGRPPLDTWVTALGMRVFGTKEWSIRLFDLILSVPALVLMMLLLRRLCGSGCALLAGLLLAVFPLSGYLGFAPLMVLLSLWALWRYLLLIGALGKGSRSRLRYSIELGIALFLLIQLSWVGVFYALTIGLHCAAYVAIRRRMPWVVPAVIAVSSLLGVALNLYVMTAGYRSNIAVENDTKRPAQFTIDRGELLPPLVQKLGPDREETAWERTKAQFGRWMTGGERGAVISRSQLAKVVAMAGSNFSPAILVFCGLYVVYLAAAHVVLRLRRVLAAGQTGDRGNGMEVRRPFVHLWFFLFPGLLFLLVFRGLALESPYGQASLAVFVAVGAASGVLLIGDVFRMVHRGLGGAVAAILTIVLVVFCNQILADHRAVHTVSPRTYELFARLSRDIPRGQGLLTFKDFVDPQIEGQADAYRPEYAWYLDREMEVANAWHYNPNWAKTAQIDEVVGKTVSEVRRQAGTGRFVYYLVPAHEAPDYDPLYAQSRERQLRTSIERTGLTWDPNQDIISGKVREAPPSLAALDPNELERRLNDRNWADDTFLYWEKHRRYREALIVRLKELYSHEYFDNQAIPGDEDFDREGNTPCYLFDLIRPTR